MLNKILPMTGVELQTSGIESDLLSYLTFWREKLFAKTLTGGGGRRKGGRGERKVLGCVRDGILALCAATMEEFPCTRPPAAGYADQRRRGVRGSCSCSAEHRLQRERNGREQPARRSRAGGLRCAAALTVSRDERFELAAGPLAAQARGAA